MNYGYMVIYQKKDDLIYRAVKTKPMYKVGDTTSMGWKVKGIQHLYNGKVYSRYEFNNKLQHKRKMHEKVNALSDNLGRLLNYLVWFFIVLQICVNLLSS